MSTRERKAIAAIQQANGQLGPSTYHSSVRKILWKRLASSAKKKYSCQEVSVILRSVLKNSTLSLFQRHGSSKRSHRQQRYNRDQTNREPWKRFGVYNIAGPVRTNGPYCVPRNRSVVHSQSRIQHGSVRSRSRLPCTWTPIVE